MKLSAQPVRHVPVGAHHLLISVDLFLLMTVANCFSSLRTSQLKAKSEESETAEAAAGNFKDRCSVYLRNAN